MHREAWSAAVHGVAKSQTWLSDFTLTFQFYAFWEGNGNPLQCSCLENPMDGEAWWAAGHGVTKSRTWLKRLSSSSSSSKITADGDCSHEIKRCLLLGRKVMTNLDSILKSRDITSSTKVCLVKAMTFPVVMYECESWTIKKAERRRIDAAAELQESLGLQGDPTSPS